MTRRIFCKVLLVVVAILGLFLLSGVLLAQGRSEEALEHVKEVQERNTDRLMAMNGVEGTAVGINENDQFAVKVFTAGPGVRGIPQELEGIPVQVVVTGKFYALSATGWYERPVPIGVSTGHPDISAGTIGCRVTKGSNVFALSNNHVYANENLASIGDNVLQPGAYDGGVDPDDAIGTLADFEPIVFHPRARNTIDAAIASTNTEMVDNATPDDGYGTPSSETATAYVGQNVQKYGRNGHTYGEVTGINATVRVGYSRGVARFVGQIIIGPSGFSAGGDSGSLIVTNDESCNPVGLLFAGSSTVTIANPIDLVLERFVVTVDGEEPTQNNPPAVSITSPADGSNFDSGATILFEGTASDTEDGDLTANLDWISSIDGLIGAGGSFSTNALSNGNHTITASVIDTGGKTGSDSISITVGTPQEEPTTVSVVSITYSTIGRGKHLLITVALEDDLGNPVEGASVSIDLENITTSQLWTSVDTTGTDGTLTYKLRNAPSGTYTTTVTDVTTAGLTWDGLTPDNGYEK
jgi:hypothetical protein